jgi:threonine/homoserine/homoserine lactone efflux protein
MIAAVLASALTQRTNRASFKRRMERLSGLVFIGFAVDLVLDNR